jgi:hypothetical protein
VRPAGLNRPRAARCFSTNRRHADGGADAAVAKQQGEYTTVGGRTPIKTDGGSSPRKRICVILIQQGLFRKICSSARTSCRCARCRCGADRGFARSDPSFLLAGREGRATPKARYAGAGAPRSTARPGNVEPKTRAGLPRSIRRTHTAGD